ncbi:MAG: hypothetical protein NHB15_00215 [Methanosarcina barkeri]|nr:hypothetical protein [Methanosarcina sp. ERenArc_MAG2]
MKYKINHIRRCNWFSVLATLSRLFLNIPLHQLWNGALNDIPTVPHDGTLPREKSTSQIYVILNGNKKKLESSNVVGQVHILWYGALAKRP